MILLDSITIHHDTEERIIELWQGDLTEMPPEEAVDILVVSAFPNSYLPLQGTLIGALHQKGISVKALSNDKQVDLREYCSCWLSKEVKAEVRGIQFDHILCFEPANLGSPADVVGDIFRSLVPFIIGDMQVIQVAMPLVSSGNKGASVSEMVDALFTAATNWMENGLPLKRLKIVECSPMKAAEIKGAFEILKRHYQKAVAEKKRKTQYDLFISYSHKNADIANSIVEDLKALKPDMRIFIDHQELIPGIAWQDKLYRSLDDSRMVLTLYSPEYVISKACQEEFNFTSLLHARSGEKVLFPILLYDTDLLPQMSKWQYIDCRVADRTKVRAACQQLFQRLAIWDLG